MLAHRQPAAFSQTSQDIANYTAAADYSDSVEGDGLLVMSNGAIVFERYNGSTTGTSAHLLASGTKSFSAAIFALGATDGIWTLDENVSQTITEWIGVPNKSQITIRQLLSLTSGLVDSPDYSPTNVANLDTYDLAINGTTTPYAPGVACIYAASNFQVLAAMLQRKTGQDPVQYLSSRLLSTLGFSADHVALWTRDIKGNPQMAGGALFSAHEWVNYGQLWIQQGQWQGATLLDPGIMNTAVTYASDAFLGYGLSWWLNRPNQNTYNPPVDQLPLDGFGDGTQIAVNAPPDMYMAAGAGKQRLYVIPSLGLVVVRFGHDDNSAFTDHDLLGYLLGERPRPPFFNGEATIFNSSFLYLQFADGTPFGYYNYDAYDASDVIYHDDLGYLGVIDAADGESGIYFYDFLSSTYFYTSPSYPFPYLYDFTLNTVLYYYPDLANPGHYTSNPRYFYNFSTGQIITK